MGTIQHHTIIATTWNSDHFDEIRRWVDTLEPRFRECFAFQEAEVTNGYRSLVLFPDGSKEGWDTSAAFDDLRDELIDRLQRRWNWVEATFGEIDRRITRHDRSQTDSE